MHHAGLTEVWNLLRVIVARQAPFSQIMIAVGAAFFVVMAIEGMRASVLAMKRAATPIPAPKDERKESASRAALARNEDSAARVFAGKPSLRSSPRPKRKLLHSSRPASLVKKG